MRGGRIWRLVRFLAFFSSFVRSIFLWVVGGKIIDDDVVVGVWRNREDAHRGGTGPWHRKARGAAREMYEKIVFTTMELVVENEVGEWSFAEWTD